MTHLDKDAAIHLLKDHIQLAGGVRKYAKHLDCSYQYIQRALSGKVPLGPKILNDLNLTVQKSYAHKS